MAAAVATSSLKFLGGQTLAPEHPVLADVRGANALSIEALKQLLEISKRALYRDETLDLLAAADAVCASTGSKPKSIRNTLRTLFFVLQGAAKHGLAPASVRDDFIGLGLETEKADVVSTVWDTIGQGISQIAADRAVDARSLLDAEWRFGVTVSTDEIGKVGSTWCQLKLEVPSSSSSSDESSGGGEGGGRNSAAVAAGNAGGDTKSHHLELSIPQFYELLGQLEKARSYVEYLGAATG